MQQRLQDVVINIAIDERHDDASHHRKLNKPRKGPAIIIPQHDTEINESHHENMPHLRPQTSSSDSQSQHENDGQTARKSTRSGGKQDGEKGDEGGINTVVVVRAEVDDAQQCIKEKEEDEREDEDMHAHQFLSVEEATRDPNHQ